MNKNYAQSKFDVGQKNLLLHLPFKPDEMFKKQRASKVPNHLNNKVNRLLDILQEHEIISSVKKRRTAKRKHIHYSCYHSSQRRIIKNSSNARYLNSLIDESKCNWPIEPIRVVLTKIDGKNFTTADMNSAYNQMPLDDQSRRLTQIFIGNQQYEFNRLFYSISIGPAAF